MVGDIVRVRYVCKLTTTGTVIFLHFLYNTLVSKESCNSFLLGQVVMSTKNVMQKPWVEFVLGIDQVIKGFDRALPNMSVGERSRLTFTAEYAC